MRKEHLRPIVLTKVISPTEEMFKGNKMKPLNHLIQNGDGDNLLLYREIKQDEGEWFKEERLFTYEGETYVMLANLPSEEHAMEVIESYWGAIKELNSLTN